MLLTLRRPIVARIATIAQWPLILIDVTTHEGIVGRAYLEPYTAKVMRYLVQALHDFGELLKGRRVAPVELYAAARRSLHFVDYQGLRQLPWRPRHGGMGCARKGRRCSAVRAARRLRRRRQRVQQQWLVASAAGVAGDEALALRDEGAFTGLKLRLGRDRPADDIAALEAIRRAVGDDMHLMADFNQGLDLGEALQRCHGIDDIGLA